MVLIRSQPNCSAMRSMAETLSLSSLTVTAVSELIAISVKPTKSSIRT